jgi:hypothetical protein
MERFEAVRTQALQTITADITSGNHSNKVGPART